MTEAETSQAKPNGAATDGAMALARTHPLTTFGFDALVAGAARLRPSRVAVCDISLRGEGDIAHGALDRRIGAFRRHLQDLRFPLGSRVILCATPNADGIVALTGVIAAGLEPVLAPLHLSQRALAEGARAASAVALIAPASFGGFDLEETLLGVAAATPSIRLLGTLGQTTIDGAVDFTAASLDATTPEMATTERASEKVSIGALDSDGALAFLEQGAFLGYGLDLVAKARISANMPIISLVSPGTIAGLVAGPLAALLSGAPLHFLAPFHASAFLAHLDEIGPARLVAPKAILPDLDRADLFASGALVSCIAISQRGAEHVDTTRCITMCPIVDIVSDGAAAINIALALQQNEAASRVA